MLIEAECKMFQCESRNLIRFWFWKSSKAQFRIFCELRAKKRFHEQELERSPTCVCISFRAQFSSVHWNNVWILLFSSRIQVRNLVHKRPQWSPYQANMATMVAVASVYADLMSVSFCAVPAFLRSYSPDSLTFWFIDITNVGGSDVGEICFADVWNYLGRPHPDRTVRGHSALRRFLCGPFLYETNFDLRIQISEADVLTSPCFWNTGFCNAHFSGLKVLSVHVCVKE